MPRVQSPDKYAKFGENGSRSRAGKVPGGEASTVRHKLKVTQLFT